MTKLWVSLGTFLQLNSGETPSEMCIGPDGGGVLAAHVYFCGMVPPSGKAGLERTRGGATFGRGGASGCCACAEAPGAAERNTTVAKEAQSFMRIANSFATGSGGAHPTGAAIGLTYFE
jgi:hypothetical protein